jgi:proton glutamate symport protein
MQDNGTWNPHGPAAPPESSLLGVTGSFHIRAAAVLMLIGVDTLMDMGRTAMNVIGNCMASDVVARWEGDFKLIPLATAKIPTP